MTTRRNFIKKVAAAGTGAFVLPRFSIGKSGVSPNSKLNVAFVGMGGIGGMATTGMKDENMVAVCDVDSNILNSFKDKPCKKFQDYREMLDKMGNEIDAVCVSTPDHSHFKITLDAMQCGKHVCVQKPLTHNIWQCRELEKARKYYKVQTQMMNQGHATEQIRMLKEWHDSGVAGKINQVHVGFSGPTWWQEGMKGQAYFRKPSSYPLAVEDCPKNIDWNLWINQGKEVGYNKDYAKLSWRGYWDYGTGMLGDWFCHTADAPVWILDLKDPISVELIKSDNNNPSTAIIPNSSTIKWTFAATNKHPELEMYWYDGDNKPEVEPPHDIKSMRTGGMYMIGDKLTIHSGVRPNFAPQVSSNEFFREYKKNLPAKTIPRVRQHNLYNEWVDAIKGDIKEAGSNFSYASQLTELALLGVLVQRFGGKINWDSKNLKAIGRPELDAYIKEPERANWASVRF